MPQHDSTNLPAWAATHPVLEPVVRAVGLHQAFTAPAFILVVVVLALSTALCAWDRTRVAIAKHRRLLAASDVDADALADKHDMLIACDPSLAPGEALSIASDTLQALGVKTASHGDLVSDVSPGWSVWGSPVFHWALFALMVSIALGSLLRSAGQMGIAVGQTKPDQASSYGTLATGPWYRWANVHRSIRVDAFDLDYVAGGVDRGPTPTVSVLDASGKVLKSQRVYPNHTLGLGTLNIYPTNYGLAPVITVTDINGASLGTAAQLVDFSAEASGGTVPTSYLTVRDDAGNPALNLTLTVPLDRADSNAQRLPAKPTARVLVTDLNNQKLLDTTLSPGQSLKLPTGQAVQLDAVVYYARLKLVDDPTVPLLYASLIVATCGLALTTLARQQIVQAAAVSTPDGVRLAVRLRLWRNSPTTRSEIQSELTRALGEPEKGPKS